MQIKILLFAQLKDIVGSSEVVLEVKNGCTGKQLIDKLINDYPDITPLKESLMLSMDDDYITVEDIIKEGSEIAALTPVSGG